MKKLQNNFTTEEQSKRLLELGVPADSADMYYKDVINTPYVFIPNVVFSKYKVVESITPCWSVGRLIVILELTIGKPFEDSQTIGNTTLLSRVLSYYESANKLNKLDFSKLEK